jgi:hypothetical protein
MKGSTPYSFFWWYAALLTLGVPFVLLYGTLRFLNLVLCVPFLIAALFCLSVVQVAPYGDHLKYRRFLRWKAISYSAVRECRESWVYGYLRTNRYLPPWGGLYFTRKQVGFSWDSSVVSSIRSKARLE